MKGSIVSRISWLCTDAAMHNKMLNLKLPATHSSLITHDINNLINLLYHNISLVSVHNILIFIYFSSCLYDFSVATFVGITHGHCFFQILSFQSEYNKNYNVDTRWLQCIIALRSIYQLHVVTSISSRLIHGVTSIASGQMTSIDSFLSLQ